MSDIKIDKRKVVKVSNQKPLSIDLNPSPSKVEVKNIPLNANKDFTSDDSLQRAAVFVSGWKSKNESNKIKDIDDKDFTRRISNYPSFKKPKKKNKLFHIILFCLILIILVYFLSNFFEKTNIVIEEKEQTINLSSDKFNLLKSKNPQIGFEVMIINDKDSKEIILTDSEEVSNYATGIVTLYNEYSAKPQTISARSYLADSSGKTYRTDKVVTIPGYKTEKNKIIPGQVPVSITAFLPGDTYNTNSMSFNFSAYKGTNKFNKIYAKTTKPISGGAQGLVYVLSASDKGNIKAFADTSFRTRIMKKTEAEVPKGYILYKEASNFSYSLNDSEKFKTPNSKIQIYGSVNALLLKEDDLINAIIKKKLPDISEEEKNEIVITQLKDLNFKFTNTDQIISKSIDNVGIELTGDLKFMWKPNKDILKTKILGLDKNQIANIFKLDPGIRSANIRIFPPWNKYLPNNPEKINIKTN